MIRDFFKILWEKIDILSFSISKNSIWEKAKEYIFERNNIEAIIQTSLVKNSTFSPWIKDISHIIKIPYDIEISKNDMIRDKNWKNYIIVFIEEKVALSRENKYKKIYCKEEV